MSVRKPTLGYASRTDAVIGLRAQNLSTKEIAARIGIEQRTVVALELSAARSHRRVQSCRTVLVPVDILAALGPHAAKRGIAVNELIRRLIDACVDDKIVDAVLDDADEVRAYLEGAA
ncbi:MAG: hypothetical protein QHD01_31675 [Bradyrhizobium sp.]|uniref:hypothetical protein n=1 Tax=Bradyrhizobium sp. TaxID=376 RepID=UPI0029B7EE78|nr:hypothetical protein [Bradyrhizobium sp.]MDX3971129.1 hypothetical protein [Bradyrhizobium sp.]